MRVIGRQEENWYSNKNKNPDGLWDKKVLLKEDLLKDPVC